MKHARLFGQLFPNTKKEESTWNQFTSSSSSRSKVFSPSAYLPFNVVCVSINLEHSGYQRCVYGTSVQNYLCMMVFAVQNVYMIFVAHFFCSSFFWTECKLVVWFMRVSIYLMRFHEMIRKKKPPTTNSQTEKIHSTDKNAVLDVLCVCSSSVCQLAFLHFGSVRAHGSPILN